MNRERWEQLKIIRLGDVSDELAAWQGELARALAEVPEDGEPSPTLAEAIAVLERQVEAAKKRLQAAEDETYEEALADARWDAAKARRNDS